ncbi:hypothetical protein KQX54_010819 [Cotesia glomerata]|uniref:Uncharacterized protein n=1 Tax=Cotesia glomerata TaxID=32391 RepID=A0AAV7J275_COTGL|nr:hypothetical protein KQX54_010819 [Cotesia glomerata]
MKCSKGVKLKIYVESTTIMRWHTMGIIKASKVVGRRIVDFITVSHNGDTRVLIVFWTKVTLSGNVIYWALGSEEHYTFMCGVTSRVKIYMVEPDQLTKSEAEGQEGKDKTQQLCLLTFTGCILASLGSNAD